MLARTSFERIRPLEPTWPSDPHLPPIIRLRPDNRDPPIAPPITEEVFNKRNNSVRTTGSPVFCMSTVTAIPLQCTLFTAPIFGN
jgi:hypothetical protein